MGGDLHEIVNNDFSLSTVEAEKLLQKLDDTTKSDHFTEDGYLAVAQVIRPKRDALNVFCKRDARCRYRTASDIDAYLTYNSILHYYNSCQTLINVVLRQKLEACRDA